MSMKLINGKSYKDNFFEQLVTNCNRFGVGYMFCDNPHSPTTFSFENIKDENHKWYLKSKFNHGIIEINTIKSHVYVTLNNGNLGYNGAHLYFSNDELLVIELSKCTVNFINSIKQTNKIYGVPFKQIKEVDCEKDGYMIYI